MSEQKAPVVPLQTKFIDRCVASRSKCSVYLVNGIKLSGIIEDHDNYTIQLVQDRSSQLVYKHAISTIVPATPF